MIPEFQQFLREVLQFAAVFSFLITFPRSASTIPLYSTLQSPLELLSLDNLNHYHLRSYHNHLRTTPTKTEINHQPSHHRSINDTNDKLPTLDCNLTSLYDNIQSEGSNHGSFKDVIVNAMGAMYHLHCSLVLSYRNRDLLKLFCGVSWPEFLVGLEV
ncbi:hypothetical protein Hanom_Chr04g00296001 [Helianthus anomalus]